MRYRKKIKLTLTLGTGRWDSTRRLNWISFIFNNREVTKRYYLYGKYFVRERFNFDFPYTAGDIFDISLKNIKLLVVNLWLL